MEWDQPECNVVCYFCEKNFHRKLSNVKKLNFCCRRCYCLYLKSINVDNKLINKWTKSMWTNMNVRCGKYRSNSKKKQDV